MKKIYGVLLTVALVATMVMPGFAGPSQDATPVSPSKPSSPAPVEEAVANVINEETMPAVNVAGVEAKVATPELAEQVMKVAAMPTVLSDLGVVASAKLSAVMEFSYEGDIPEGGVQIPFVVNSAAVGDLVYILHRMPSGQWEKVGETILGADLTVVGTFTSFSPVAIMVVDAATVASIATSTEVLAPKTGE